MGFHQALGPPPRAIQCSARAHSDRSWCLSWRAHSPTIARAPPCLAETAVVDFSAITDADKPLGAVNLGRAIAMLGDAAHARIDAAGPRRNPLRTLLKRAEEASCKRRGSNSLLSCKQEVEGIQRVFPPRA